MIHKYTLNLHGHVTVIWCWRLKCCDRYCDRYSWSL